MAEKRLLAMTADGSLDPRPEPSVRTDGIVSQWQTRAGFGGQMHVDDEAGEVRRPMKRVMLAVLTGAILLVACGAGNGMDSVNAPPVAYAGADTTCTAGETVALDGSGSSDADGDDLLFSWTEDPANPVPDLLSSAQEPVVSFTPTVAGIYRFGLVTSDGTASSAPDTVVVTVTPSRPPHYDVLIVDFNIDEVELLQEVFGMSEWWGEEVPFAFTVTDDSTEARRLLREEDYHLIILDLPTVDPLERIGELRTAFAKDTPVIVVTGYMTRAYREELEALPGVAVFLKPYDLYEFTAAVARLLPLETASRAPARRSQSAPDSVVPAPQ